MMEEMTVNKHCGKGVSKDHVLVGFFVPPFQIS